MITTARPNRHRNATQEIVRQLRVTSYERASGLATSLLIFFGCLLVGMFAAWLTSQVWQSHFDPQRTPIEGLAGGGGNQSPVQVELDEPVKEEIQSAEEPALDITVQAVTDAVSTRLAQLDALVSSQSPGTGPTIGTKIGSRIREIGPDPPDVLPRWERWEIRYAAESNEVYARQLDGLGIELGAVAGSNPTLDIAAGFSTGQPRRSSKIASEEKRLYLTWLDGSLVEADRQLLALAGIPTSGRIILQLIPQAVEDQLARLESDYAGRRKIETIKKTIFGVRPVGDRFEFFVLDQRYRLSPKNTTASE